jgi:MFS family permease
VAWQAASQTIASVTGSLVGLSLTWILSAEALNAYGWRIAFLLGAITLPVGFILRRTMPETLHTPEDHPKSGGGTSPWAILRDNRRILGLGVVVLAGGTISTYVSNYMTTFAQNTLHMAAGVSFAATMVPNAIGLFSSLYGGWLSDRIGRRPVMLVSRGLALIITVPVFYWIVASHSGLALLGGMGLLAFVGGAGQAVFYVSLSETLPKAVRGRAFATLYATAIAIFGGTTQPVITWLIHATGNPMAPGWYLMIATAASLVAIALIVESAPVKLRARTA